ncbi:hypothetical protein PG985_005540 [Apiospora marii]|uniref:uncharacterized protein n=1 Tax=Apiospora marii TaxID=335849 RepID=UPI00312DF35A
MFRRKGGQRDLLTGASGNAAALIGGVTLHSAANIGFEGSNDAPRRLSEEEKLRWKSKVMLIMDEISQVGGLTLAAVDSRLRQYPADSRRPFGGIPIVIFFGDFYQFEPVQQTSLLLPRPRRHSNANPYSQGKHLMAHKIFVQFRSVVMLRDQVRAAGCPKLRGFLQRLRSGEQTEEDFGQLRRRLYKPSHPTFADGLRAITPLNQDQWNLNMAAVVQYARAAGRHVSIFAARHSTEAGRPGMPVVVTRNLHVGLKLVNGAPFTAVDVVPDPVYASIAVASDVTFHLRPPLTVLLQSDAIAELAIPGLPPGTVMLRSQTVAIPESLRGKGGPLSRDKPGFQRVTHRTGPLCTSAFAVTDRKSQGKQFAEVLLNLKGAPPRDRNGAAAQLHEPLRAAVEGDAEPERSDFIEPRNVLDSDLKNAAARLERQGGETRERFWREHGQESWFAAWGAMELETTAAGRGWDGAGRSRKIENRTEPYALTSSAA